jgi:hypothetical protein
MNGRIVDEQGFGRTTMPLNTMPTHTPQLFIAAILASSSTVERATILFTLAIQGPCSSMR